MKGKGVILQTTIYKEQDDNRILKQTSFGKDLYFKRNTPDLILL